MRGRASSRTGPVYSTSCTSPLSTCTSQTTNNKHQTSNILFSNTLHYDSCILCRSSLLIKSESASGSWFAAVSLRNYIPYRSLPIKSRLWHALSSVLVLHDRAPNCAIVTVFHTGVRGKSLISWGHGVLSMYVRVSTFHTRSSPRRHKGMEIDKPTTFVVSLLSRFDATERFISMIDDFMCEPQFSLSAPSSLSIVSLSHIRKSPLS
jgi:hypothetical protein